MNIIFVAVIILSSGVLIFKDPESIMNIILNGADKGVQLCISLLAIYAFMLGILELIEKSGLHKKLANFLKPAITFLFGKQKDEVNEQIAINLSSNILGMGNAATPSGIKAMQMLDKKDGKINQEMMMLFIINSMSLQIIPTTIISLRIAAGSLDAAKIILPILAVSLLSTSLGILLTKLVYRRKTK